MIRSGTYLPLLAIAATISPVLTAQTKWGVTTPALPVQWACAATYDSVNHRAIVFSTSSNTTWVAPSATGTMTQIGPSGSGPGWNFEPSLAYDSTRQRAVYFGGSGSTTTLDATWEWDGSSWQQLSLVIAPPARQGAGMCFDAAAGVVLLAAGDAAPYGSSPQPLADVWTFDGTQWTPLPPSPVGPVGLTEMAYDTVRARCVALAANGTFEWQSGAFVQVMTATTPSPRRVPGFVYDSFRERIVLHGGVAVNATTRSDVWEYDGTDWVQRQPLGAFMRRHAHGMVYDPELRSVRAFAGAETVISAGGLVTTHYGHASELRYEPVSPPLAQFFAPGCYFSTQLFANGLPWLGESFALTMPVTGGGLPPLMVFGNSNQQAGVTPLPVPLGFLGFPNCDLLVSPDIVLSPPVAAGSAVLTVAIPNQPMLLGSRLYVQGFEPNLTGTGTGTIGLLVQVGGR
jgi:hypothetical protein